MNFITPPPRSSVNFKAYVPVQYYVKHDESGNYRYLDKPEDIRRCQRQVVTNLNKEPSKIEDEAYKQFVNFYKQHDKDYLKRPYTASFFDGDLPASIGTYIITGEDAVNLRLSGHTIGVNKKIAKETTGCSESSDTVKASLAYMNDGRNILRNQYKQVTDSNGDKAILRLYFIPEYTKRKHILKGYKFHNARFVKQED